MPFSSPSLPIPTTPNNVRKLILLRVSFHITSEHWQSPYFGYVTRHNDPIMLMTPLHDLSLLKVG